MFPCIYVHVYVQLYYGYTTFADTIIDWIGAQSAFAVETFFKD